ncbi:MAG TPA: ABC transporter permease [Vicinamibacterales bacterium]
MLSQLRVAVRLLLKNPGFTAIAVVPLALGIGATAAVFTLIQGVLLTPAPYVQPDRLVLISPRSPERQSGDASWPAVRWLDWQQHAPSFDGVAAYFWTFNFLVRDQGSESIEGMGVTLDYFRVTGLRPLLGRTFLAAEAAPNAPPTVLIGYNLWQRTFNGDPNIVGKTLHISRITAPVTIIGVMPPTVRFLPSPGDAKEPNYDVNALVDFWMAVAPDPKQLDGAYWDVVGRLKTNARTSDAQAELALLASREEAGDRRLKAARPYVQPLSEQMNADGRRVLLPLLGAAALVLLIACGNTAALLLVRGLQRRREYAVRIALGVSRRTLVGQATVESALVAVVAGAFGLGLAAAIVRIMQSVGAHAIPRMDSVHVGWPVGVATLALALAAAGLAGLVPALRATQVDPNDMLKSAGPRSSGAPADRRLLRGLTIAQTALTLALLVGAGLLVRTMTQLWRAPAGFTTDHVLTMTVTAVQGDWIAFHRGALGARLPSEQRTQRRVRVGSPPHGHELAGRVRDRRTPRDQPWRPRPPANPIRDAWLLLAARHSDGRRTRLPTDR